MSTTASDRPLSLSVDETAALLGAGVRQTYEAVRRGEIPAVRIGGRWYVKRAELLRMFGLDDTAPCPQGARGPHEPQDSAATQPGI